MKIRYIKYLIVVFQLMLGIQASYAQLPVLYPNFPVLIDSSFSEFTNPKTQLPLIADLDKDGQKEIITSVNSTIACRIFVIRSNGTIQSGFPKSYNSVPCDFASGDVNGDGYLDIVVRFQGQIVVIDRFGNDLPGFPAPYDDGIISLYKFVSLYDLDNDGRLEIIVNKDKEIAVFNYQGQFRAGWPKLIAGNANYNPAIGDIDGDGFAEIIISTFKIQPIDSSFLNVFRHNGINFSNNWPVQFDSGYISWAASPSLYISKYSKDSTFISVPYRRSIQMPYSLHKIIKYNINGEVMNINYQITVSDLGTMVIGDINGSGDLDFSSGTGYSGFAYLTVYDKYLNIMNGWPQARGGGNHFSTPSLGKAQNSPGLCIISNQLLQIDKYGRIFIYTDGGTELSWSPVISLGTVPGVSFTDLDNDGDAEIIVRGTEVAGLLGRVRVYIYAYTFPGIAFTPENFPWPAYGHDRYRTNQYGFIPPDEPIGIKPITNKVPENFRLHQNYPNPFNASTRIKFDISRRSSVRLSIYDLLGREVKVLVNETLQPGTYKLDFEEGTLSSGVYFCKLLVRGGEKGSYQYNEVKKMILLK